jgi:site-specific DNA recombinase
VTKTQTTIPRAGVPLIRCAVYTRKSTEEGLQQSFNSLDAQREASEAYIASQLSDGWTCLPDRFDDGGFSGGTTERPALQRLMSDIEAGKVDCVVVHRVDRLSRSLLDFARMMQIFEQRKVSFVSVTQQFNTGTSMGRLVLNVLLSFAQFEREIISERTRDKIAMTRRRGKWAGGLPPLGYDVDRERTRLFVNEDEAVRVRAIFSLYVRDESLLQVVQELARRGWFNKRCLIKAGHERGGYPFNRTSLHRLLTNVMYIGKVRYKTEVHAGEHPGIIDLETWQKTQTLLERNARSGGAPVRNEFGALLKGILRCVPCGLAMTPAHTTKGNRRYRYYTCCGAQKHGWAACPSKSVPAAQIERVIIEQIKCVGSDPAVLREVLTASARQQEGRAAELEVERRELERDLGRWHGEIQRLSGELGRSDGASATVGRLADLQERIAQAEQRIATVREQVRAIRDETLDPGDVANALAQFTPVWDTLTPREQARLVGLLVKQVDYDGANGKLQITFHQTGIKSLID